MPGAPGNLQLQQPELQLRRTWKEGSCGLFGRRVNCCFRRGDGRPLLQSEPGQVGLHSVRVVCPGGRNGDADGKPGRLSATELIIRCNPAGRKEGKPAANNWSVPTEGCPRFGASRTRQPGPGQVLAGQGMSLAGRRRVSRGPPAMQIPRGSVPAGRVLGRCCRQAASAVRS